MGLQRVGYDWVTNTVFYSRLRSPYSPGASTLVCWPHSVLVFSLLFWLLKTYFSFSTTLFLRAYFVLWSWESSEHNCHRSLEKAVFRGRGGFRETGDLTLEESVGFILFFIQIPKGFQKLSEWQCCGMLELKETRGSWCKLFSKSDGKVVQIYID